MLTDKDVERVRWRCRWWPRSLRSLLSKMRKDRDQAWRKLHPPPIDLRQVRDLLLPALREMTARRVARDPLHPCHGAEFSMYVEEGAGLVIQADCRDRTRRRSTMSLDEIDVNVWDASSILALFRAKLGEICPEHIFEDESVIAYDDSGWLAQRA